MKRLYLLLIALVAAWSASANPVDRESAQQKATKFILGNKALARGQLKIRLASASDAYYVFNIADNGGFVIVSGDDATPEILGYSKSGTFDSQKIPDKSGATDPDHPVTRHQGCPTEDRQWCGHRPTSR